MRNEHNNIELYDLKIGYKTRQGKKVIAEKLNATVRSGKLTCLLGSNGVGKSTLLRTIASFQPKLGGEIYIKKKEIEEYKERELSKAISVVLTERFVDNNMTSYELISMGRSPYTGFWGRLEREDKAAVERAIELVRIQHLRGRMLHTLSDGERQKAMIAKALAQDTPIIILDEPTAFLDFPSKVDMMQLLHRLSRETMKTIFLSTHDLELALQVADMIWLMDDDKQLHIGTPEDLALSGDLGRFFQQKEIIFDETTGLFRIENDYDRVIQVLGHGHLFAMIRKALLRNRILASRDTETDTFIDARGGRISLHRSGKPSQAIHSIEQLLGEIL